VARTPRADFFNSLLDEVELTMDAHRPTPNPAPDPPLPPDPSPFPGPGPGPGPTPPQPPDPSPFPGPPITIGRKTYGMIGQQLEP